MQTALIWMVLIHAHVSSVTLATVPSAPTLTNVNLKLTMTVTKMLNVKTPKAVIHVNVPRDTLVTVLYAMTLTNVKLLNVKQMPSVSIYQLILNVSVKTDSVSLANHVLTLTNVLGTDNCHKNAKCKNTDGGFECKCNKDTLVMAKFALMRMNVPLVIPNVTKMPHVRTHRDPIHAIVKMDSKATVKNALISK